MTGARRLFEPCWGTTTSVKDLDRRDWDRFIRLRQSRQLKPERGYHKGRVVDRQIEYDLRFLLAVCNWALTVREKGQPLLGCNPFRGFPVPAEQNINQPTTPQEEIAARFRPKLPGNGHYRASVPASLPQGPFG